MAKTVNWPRLTFFAGLAGSAAIIIYLTLYWDRHQPSMLLNSAVDPLQVDLYAEHAHGVKYDEDGKLVQTYSTPRALHYLQSGQTVMTLPVLQLMTSDGAIWDGVSRTGIMIGDTEIQMFGDVVISNKEEGTELHTEELHYFPERREANSDVAVRVRKFNDTTRAIGMRADLNRNRVELLRQVEGEHVQP